MHAITITIRLYNYPHGNYLCQGYRLTPAVFQVLLLATNTRQMLTVLWVSLSA